MHKRVKFFDQRGEQQRSCSGAPVVLASFGAEEAGVLASCGIAGTLVTDWSGRELRMRSVAA